MDGAVRLQTPVLIIGSGIAGLTTALTLAEAGIESTVITSADEMTWSNSVLAQGGIVSRGANDSPRDLEEDILTAGWNHNYIRAVRHLAENGPDAVNRILVEKLRVPFHTAPDGSFDMTREGGHSKARILHCADFTGRAIMETLAEAVEKSPNIRVLTGRTAIDLLTTHHHAVHLDYKYSLSNRCVGAYVLDEAGGRVQTLLAGVTVLATGGCGQVFLHSTNTSASIGAGLAMSHRAGARLFNNEYVQFHPTALFRRADRRFLISEAVRGEGARLVNAKGETFMEGYDPRADLAPRDIVTRAIMEEMLKTGEPSVYLDAARYMKQDPAARFPTIHRTCLEHGIDMTREPIPVVPAAHYFCGGVLTDLAGRTTLEHLYAVGECACTGVHGANRLASTSLLEGVLWGMEAGRDIVSAGGETISAKLANAIPDWCETGDQANEDPALLAQDWSTIRHTMWNYVGITRSAPRMRRAFEDLRDLNKHLHDFYRQTPVSKSLVDLFHGCQAAYIITMAAMRTRQSRGCHYRTD